MSIALHARMKDMETRVSDLERLVDVLRANSGNVGSTDGDLRQMLLNAHGALVEVNAALAKAEDRITALENRPKPGRPKKDLNG